MASDSPSNLIEPSIFEYLKAHGEEELEVGDKLHQITAALNRHISTCQGLLSRIHSTPSSKLPPLLKQVEDDGINPEIDTVGELAQFASNYPYYKYNGKWTRAVQNVVNTILLTAWLGGLGTESPPGEIGRLLTIEEVGQILKGTFASQPLHYRYLHTNASPCSVPVNLKDRDAFHITIEEYILALTDITEELSRLAMNSVTMGDIDLTVRISGFIKDLFAGFQLLNLKNDIVRKRVDAVKYHVKKVEDVIYDLSLRNLIPKHESSS
ncbi:Translin-1 [Parahypoxylon ruwenzoriense]